MSLKDYADEIVPGLWLGSEFAGTLPLEELTSKNIKSVVSVGKGLETPYEKVCYLTKTKQSK